MEVQLTESQRDEMLQKFNDYLAARGETNTLREKNIKKLKKHCLENAETKQYRTKMKRRFGIDPLTETENFPAMKESFSWTKFRGQLDEKFREADSETTFPLFLIAGIMQNTIGMYQLTKPSYMDWATVTTTNLVETPFAPLQGRSFPREVGSQMPYPESNTAGLSIKIRAKKYGDMMSIEQELLEDDQTGQFQQQSGEMGEYLQLLTEVLVYGKLASASGMSYAGFDVPVSETKPSYESNYPWAQSSAPLKGGGYNRPSSFGTLIQANVQTGIETLMQQKNLLGLVMAVNANRILISPKYRFDAAVLLNSAYYPSATGSAGTVGGAFSINPLQGIADLSVSRYMPNNSGVFGANSSAWYIVDDSKPWFQVVVKTPVSVEQESPTSGESFNRDIYRFKCRTRMNADIIDPRFAWQGSDGSV